MSYYDDDRRYLSPRDRYARPVSYADYGDPYDDPRRYARHERDYAPRRSNESIEEVQREFPPGSDYAYERRYRRRPTRPEPVRRASSVSGYDPHYDAAYARSRPRRTRHEERRKRRQAKEN